MTAETTEELEDKILLPECITIVCGQALVFYCRKRRITDEKTVRELAALVEETAQRIHLAMVREQQA